MNVCEHTTKMASPESFFKGATRGLREEWMEGNLKGNLSEVNTRDVSRGQNELVGKFKMAAGDMT